MALHQTDSMGRSNWIKAVSFDVGGTLIDPWPSVGHIYADVASRYGIRNVSPDELNLRFVRAWNARHGFDYSRNDWAELVDRTFAGLTPTPPSQTFFDELWARFDQPDAWRIYDDVWPTITTLRERGFKLAIISNWDQRLRPLLARLGLSGHFDTIVISVELGMRKPSREIFSAAAFNLDLPPGAILHVGDNPDEDLAGARVAGFDAVLLDRSATAVAEDVIHRLTDLCELLQ